MRVLIIGGGGREHALAWKLRQDDPDLDIVAAPGNPGIAELADCVSIAATDLPALERLARELDVDLTIVGPEAPLALGIVDRFRAAGLPIFGPTRAAAEIETSKAFAKQLMLDAGIPTARAEMHTEPAAAKGAARAFGAPVVIKASGLAAGKGVIVCATLPEAERAIDDMLEGNMFGDAGHEVLVEEFMEGEEISIFAITDGDAFVVLPGLQDHKRLLDGDLGPNTGGMGAYLPVSLMPPAADLAGASLHGARDAVLPGALMEVPVRAQILAPVLAALAAAGRPFSGLLYAGLMVTRDAIKVVEFNCRFGDPETEALLPALGIPLLPLLMASASGGLEGHAGEECHVLPRACVTTVLAAANYPNTPRTGDVISIPPVPDDVIVFHAGTARNAAGELVTAGGRVLAISATAPTVAEASARSLAFAESVQFDGKQLRTDIGWREVARSADSNDNS